MPMLSMGTQATDPLRRELFFKSSLRVPWRRGRIPQLHAFRTLAARPLEVFGFQDRLFREVGHLSTSTAKFWECSKGERPNPLPKQWWWGMVATLGLESAARNPLLGAARSPPARTH